MNNTAKTRGGAIYYTGVDYQLNLTRVQLIENKQTNGGTDGTMGGGGLYIQGKVTANIRECMFVRNEANMSGHGHQIMTSKVSSDIPSITLVNTNFTGVKGSHPFYGYNGSSGSADNYARPSACSSCHSARGKRPHHQPTCRQRGGMADLRLSRTLRRA